MSSALFIELIGRQLALHNLDIREKLDIVFNKLYMLHLKSLTSDGLTATRPDQFERSDSVSFHLTKGLIG